MSGVKLADHNPVRQNRSFLAGAEQNFIQWILPRLPESISSLHLTMVGVAGAVLTVVGLVLCNYSNVGLFFVVLGVCLNWFGDSLDGSLARFRKEERPRFGFLVDHSCDLFAQSAMIIGFGFSPFLSLVSALTILLCYLLFSAYTYIRAATQHVHQMAYIGMGATEFRILMIGWALIGSISNLHEPLVKGLSTLDLSILVLAAFAVVGLVGKVISDARQIAREERRAMARARSNPEASSDVSDTLSRNLLRGSR